MRDLFIWLFPWRRSLVYAVRLGWNSSRKQKPCWLESRKLELRTSKAARNWEREKKIPEKRAIEGENSPQILGWLWHGAWLQEAQGGNTAGRLKVLRRDFYSCVRRADRFSCSNLINLEWFGKHTRLFPNKSYTKPPRYQVEWPAIKQNNMQISSEEDNTIQNLGNVSVTPMSNI